MRKTLSEIIPDDVRKFIGIQNTVAILCEVDSMVRSAKPWYLPSAFMHHFYAIRSEFCLEHWTLHIVLTRRVSWMIVSGISVVIDKPTTGKKSKKKKSKKKKSKKAKN